MVSQDEDDRLVGEFVAVFNMRGRRIARLENQVQELQKEQQKLSELVMRTVDLVNQRRTDVATERSHRHSDVNTDFVAFRDQTIATVVEQIVPRDRSGRRDPDRVAHATSQLCQILFQGTAPNRAALQKYLASAPERVDQLYDAANELRAAAARAGGGRWDFGTGDTIDPSKQQPWRSSPQDGRVSLVVTPAYVAEGKVVTPQLVRTTETAGAAARPADGPRR
jgi:hypothetical protein